MAGGPQKTEQRVALDFSADAQTCVLCSAWIRGLRFNINDQIKSVDSHGLFGDVSVASLMTNAWTFSDLLCFPGGKMFAVQASL